MKKAIICGLACGVMLMLFSKVSYAGAVPPFTTTFMRTVLDDADAPTARDTLEIELSAFAPLLLAERSSDPNKPSEGYMILWMSDGTEYGDDGDLIVAATAGGATKIGILWDFSGASVWEDELFLETGDTLLLETGDKLLLE